MANDNVTIYDIAAACNVSIATVSRVLNQNPKVSEQTKAKVLQKIAELGYRPNPFARGIGLHTMRLIGVLCRDVQTSRDGQAVALLTTQLQLAGYSTLLTCLRNVAEEEALAQLQAKQVDGLIIVGTPFNREETASTINQLSQELPIFTVESTLSSLPDTPLYTITSTAAAVVSQLVATLIQQGHKRLVFLTADTLAPDSLERTGFRHGVQAARLPRGSTDELCLTGNAVDHIQQLTAQCTRKPFPSAIIAATDVLAAQAKRVTTSLQLDMPIYSCVTSPLTTYAQLPSLVIDLASQCQTAAQQLLSRLRNPAQSIPIRTEFQAHWQYPTRQSKS